MIFEQHIKEAFGAYLEFIVKFKYDTRLYFTIYPVSQWEGPDNTRGISYYSKDSSDDQYEFNPEKCLCLFDGSYCWRGVWEGRLYFPEDEYWSEDLRGMADLFTKHIEPFCKDFIRKREPSAE